uniref:Uncharacterized protein n=1 Tax=Macrostomum lignano TaxID=282301 RepID=A0A1I8FC59_9PLAT
MQEYFCQLINNFKSTFRSSECLKDLFNKVADIEPNVCTMLRLARGPVVSMTYGRISSDDKRRLQQPHSTTWAAIADTVVQSMSAAATTSTGDGADPEIITELNVSSSAAEQLGLHNDKFHFGFVILWLCRRSAILAEALRLAGRRKVVRPLQQQQQQQAAASAASVDPPPPPPPPPRPSLAGHNISHRRSESAQEKSQNVKQPAMLQNTGSTRTESEEKLRASAS